MPPPIARLAALPRPLKFSGAPDAGGAIKGGRELGAVGEEKIETETSIFDEENDGKMMRKSLSVREKPWFPVSIFPNKPIQWENDGKISI